MDLQSLLKQEWLLADPRGFFAMGTASGTRTRKYHGLFSGVAGRTEINTIAQLDLSCNGVGLWAHAYDSPNGVVYHPDGYRYLDSFSSTPWPRWVWSVPEDGSARNERLEATLFTRENSGFAMRLEWHGELEASMALRPLFAMRKLHALGGEPVSFEQGYFYSKAKEGGVAVRFDFGNVLLIHWHAEGHWYNNFYYAEENARGYDHVENLYSCGRFEFKLRPQSPVTISWNNEPPPARARKSSSVPELDPEVKALKDFVLTKPAGIVAGYPWFGEWGRDTFIALPGILAGIFARETGKKRAEILSWSLEVLERWSTFIDSHGMLPNLFESLGPQWDSADATLWWTNALATIWSMSLAQSRMGFAQTLPEKFLPFLDRAIDSIHSGKHRHLHVDSQGLLEVTSEHATWMDARVGDTAVTPRTGLLPEINALWVQARILRELWKKRPVEELRGLAARALVHTAERERPNFVFLYSLPLAPAYLLAEMRTLESTFSADIRALKEKFYTPVGLRTLSPDHPDYVPTYNGDPEIRDRAYHQGPAWFWLKGPFETARARFFPNWSPAFESVPQLSTISGHFAELFDAEPPWVPRGAPAQAWSLACLEEARLRREWNTDRVLAKTLFKKMTLPRHGVFT